MAAAMKDAGINPDQVGYLNAHGTSTPLGDVAETLALKRALGDHAYRTMVSSTKSMTGHLLGAAGVVESIVCLLAMQNATVPPTINNDNLDPQIDLDITPNKPKKRSIGYALNNGFGFGGHNATLIFRTAANL